MLPNSDTGEWAAHRLPDRVRDRIAGYALEQRRIGTLIGEAVQTFLEARGVELEGIEMRLSDDGQAVMTRPKADT